MLCVVESWDLMVAIVSVGETLKVYDAGGLRDLNVRVICEGTNAWYMRGRSSFESNH